MEPAPTPTTRDLVILPWQNHASSRRTDAQATGLTGSMKIEDSAPYRERPVSRARPAAAVRTATFFFVAGAVAASRGLRAFI